jgi:hypothetical protein
MGRGRKHQFIGNLSHGAAAAGPSLAVHDTEMLAVKLTLGLLKITGGCERAARGPTLPMTRKTEALWRKTLGGV